jgi:ankyrin repeat protein
VRRIGGCVGSAAGTLQQASDLGDIEILKMLIDSGTEVKKPSVEFIAGTPLQLAAEGGHERIVKILLEAVADVNYKGGGGRYDYRTAMEMALVYGHKGVAQMLRDYGAE